MSRIINICFEEITFEFSIRTNWIEFIKFEFSRRFPWNTQLHDLNCWVVAHLTHCYEFKEIIFMLLIRLSEQTSHFPLTEIFIQRLPLTCSSHHLVWALAIRWNHYRVRHCHPHEQRKWDNPRTIFQSAHQRNDNHFVVINKSHWAQHHLHQTTPTFSHYLHCKRIMSIFLFGSCNPSKLAECWNARRYSFKRQ